MFCVVDLYFDVEFKWKKDGIDQLLDDCNCFADVNVRLFANLCLFVFSGDALASSLAFGGSFVAFFVASKPLVRDTCNRPFDDIDLYVDTRVRSLADVVDVVSRICDVVRCDWSPAKNVCTMTMHNGAKLQLINEPAMLGIAGVPLHSAGLLRLDVDGLRLIHGTSLVLPSYGVDKVVKQLRSGVLRLLRHNLDLKARDRTKLTSYIERFLMSVDETHPIDDGERQRARLVWAVAPRGRLNHSSLLTSRLSQCLHVNQVPAVAVDKTKLQIALQYCRFDKLEEPGTPLHESVSYKTAHRHNRRRSGRETLVRVVSGVLAERKSILINI